MIHIFKTIFHIFNDKKKTESRDYVRGFGDCFELLKIGFEKSDQVNLGIENYKLKRILYEFLNFEFETISSQFLKIKDLYYIYNEDYIVIDKIFANVVARPQTNPDLSETAVFEIKLQNFLLKEIITKIINHKFNLTKLQIEYLTKVLKSTNTNNEKINIIIKYLTNLEIEDQWPDYYEMARQYAGLMEELKTFRQLQHEKNELLLEIEKMSQVMDVNVILKNENAHLQTIIDLFLHRSVNNFHKFELLEFCNKGFKPLIRINLMIDYLKKLNFSSPYQFFKLSEKDKLEIRKILNSNKNKEEGFQELFNYINYTVASDEKITRQWIKKKAKYLK